MAPPGRQEGSGWCWCRGSAGGVGRGRVRVHGSWVGGVDAGADGVVGRLRGTDRQTAGSEPGGSRGDPRAPAPKKYLPPSLTWRRKSLCRRLRLGGSGSCLQSRSGERVPLGPNTLRSLKHSVSIIWGGRVTGGTGMGSPGGAAAGQDPPWCPVPPVPRSARGWRRCQWRTWRRNRCRFGPG